MRRRISLVIISLFFYAAHAQNTTQTTLRLTGTDQVGFALPLQIDDNPSSLVFGNNTWGRQIRLSRMDNTYHYDIGLDNGNEFFITKRNTNDLAFKIAHNGNIGLGITNPEAKLHIDGSIKLMGSNALEYYVSSYGDGFGHKIYGVDASNGRTDIRIAARKNTATWTDIVTFIGDGRVGIGTMDPGEYKLAVEGAIGARKIKVINGPGWADYVFNKDYNLMSLASLEAFIQKNNHLPNIPSEQEVKENGGIELGEMNAKLLEKIEELTLYVITMNKAVEKLNKEVQELKSENKTLKNK